jgi:alginate O-acetyltransferase complex protein AlgI
MSAVVKPISTPAVRLPRLLHWTPAIVLPLLVLALSPTWPRALVEWLLAAAVYAGFKWLAFANSRKARTASLGESAAFLFLWPGMDADAFFTPREVPQPSVREVAMAATLTLAGVLLLLALPSLESHWPIEIRGWLGLIGLALLLLFGVSQLISIAWRLVDVDAQPIMNKPLRATSLADFWGSRWNLAFHDIGRIFVWHPIAKRSGALLATIVVFVFSGLVHDLVMSVPLLWREDVLHAGLGLPTLYFAIQCGGVLLERSPTGKRMGLSRGWRGRVYAAVVVLAPLGLLFHQPFLQNVVLPTLKWITPT